MDQSLFAAPHGFSQRITSFIACACQGIHQMPLRHLIVLIANAHHLCLDLEFLSSRFRSRGAKSDHPDTLRLPNQLCAVTFYNHAIQQCHRRVRQVCFIGATPSSSLAACLKTSFSRLDPIPRGQATVIKSSVRCSPKDSKQHAITACAFTLTTQSDKLPSYLRSLHHIRPARPSMVS